MNCGEGLKTNAQYQEAITVFDAMPLRYDDAQTELCECRYIIAMSLMDDLKYYAAYTDYLPYLLEYKDGKYAYEYCYVKMHLTKEDATTMSYLEDLMGAQYRNSGAIYAELTDWRITILINRVGENSDSSLKYVSKNDSWFIKIHVSNAPPNGVIVLHYEIIFPDNSVESGKFYRSFEGDDSYLLCGDNWDPRYGDTGIFTINIYDSSAQVLLATASLRITN
ncbi:MAG: hypothetical protein ACC608_01515 [Anaerofustis sp.]